ncbi:MAG: dTDP-4-dehydrorhamnose 3,5-epimerase family protein [Nitrospinae bacterium]|nr:dTDP-4-dehydrorhamnose 3,5-epimerase family protein [Nitrospinota bacterium]
MIYQVNTKQLKMVPDERGRLMEILRCDDPFYQKFGQAYVTFVYPGVVKAWHFHKVQTDHFACLKGMIKLVLYDGRPGSPTKGEINQFFIGEHNNLLVSIPPHIQHGFKGISETEAMVLNIPTEPYNATEPDEFRLDAHDPSIPYEWARKDG